MAAAMTALIVIIAYLFLLVLLQIVAIAYRKGKDIHFNNSMAMAEIADNPEKMVNSDQFTDDKDAIKEIAHQASKMGALEEFRSYIAMHKYSIISHILYYVSFSMIDMLPDYMIIKKR